MKPTNQEKETTAEELKKLLVDSGRKAADINTEITMNNPGLLKPLLELSYAGVDPWAQRASRVVSLCAVQNPNMLKDFSSEMIRKLPSLKSESVRRNFLKIFMEVPVRLTKRDKEHLLAACFDFLTGNCSIGVKVYCMDVLYHLSHDFPEICKELYYTIESQMDNASVGFKSRGNKVLTKLAF